MELHALKRRARTLCGGVLIAAGALALSACGARHAGQQGHLLIIGGGLSENNAEVYGRLAELAGEGTVGVLPTASGVPEESGPREVARLEGHLGEGRASVLNVTVDNPEAANSEELAEAIASHSGVFFTGGLQSRVVAVFRPEEGDTAAYESLRDLLGRGGVIAGSSAGAAIMSDPMIRGGTSPAALQHGVTTSDDEERGVQLSQGLGFFPYGITDQHFLTRGRLGRLIVALDESGTPHGFAVDDNRAFHADLNAGVLEALGGPRAMLFVDMSGVTKSGGGFYGIRLSLLGSGDLLLADSGEVVPAPGKQRLAPREGMPQEMIARDAWGRNVLGDLMRELAFQPVEEATALDESHELRFVEDEWTRYWVGAGATPETLTIVNLRLDIRPRTASEVATAP